MVDAVASATNTVNSGRATLVQNYETFLLLLTSQLKNQDPTSPVDTNQFTAQLVQMAGVEQQLLTNDLLTELVAGGSDGLSGAVQYIGKDVVAAGSAVRLQNGEARWSYELATDATEATLEVVDSQGRVVWSGPAPDTGEGVHDFTWDGRDSTGALREDGGIYSLRISAETGSGATVDSQVLIRGRVTAVELYDGEPYVTVGGSILPLSQIISVSEAETTAALPTGETEADGGLLASAARTLNPLNLF